MRKIKIRKAITQAKDTLLLSGILLVGFVIIPMAVFGLWLTVGY